MNLRSTTFVSGEQRLFEAELVRGAALAELRAWSDMMKPMTEAMRRVGVTFAVAGERMAQALRQVAAAYGEAMERVTAAAVAPDRTTGATGEPRGFAQET